MRLERGVRLYLGDVAPLNDNVRVFEALGDLSMPMDRRTVDVAGLANIARTATSAGAAFLVRRAGKHFGSIGGAGFDLIDDEGDGLIANFDQRGCFFGGSGSGRGHGSNRLAGIADYRILHSVQRGVTQDSVSQDVLNDMHAANTRVFLRRGRIDGNDLCVGHRRIDEFCVEHARQLNVRRIACTAGDFGLAIVALDRLSDIFQIFIDRPDRRLGDGHLA